MAEQKKRLIDAAALKYRVALNDDGKMICYVLAKDIDKAPTIDPESLRPVGRWKDRPAIGRVRYTNIPVVECSECGITFCDIVSDHRSMYRYCPHCGARMEEENTHE